MRSLSTCQPGRANARTARHETLSRLDSPPNLRSKHMTRSLLIFNSRNLHELKVIFQSRQSHPNSDSPTLLTLIPEGSFHIFLANFYWCVVDSMSQPSNNFNLHDLRCYKDIQPDFWLQEPSVLSKLPPAPPSWKQE